MSTAAQETGKLVLRLSVGILVLLHGISKLQNGIEPIMGMVTGMGMPAELAYGVYIGEVLAPILVIIGLWTRPAALIMVVNMLAAVYLAHMPQLASLNEKSGGWALELQGMFLFSALAVALLGAGRYSLGGAEGKLN
ncbi:MAG TPA: DoxX family protein [Burkholderiales bacterium]|nr:DoxX family protein [Burkholderiales bacterium]